MHEQSFCMIKPDGVARRLQEDIFSYLANAGLKVIKKKDLLMPLAFAEKLYAVHKGKSFYPGLVKFITSGPVIVMVVEGEGAISKLREVMGATDPGQALSGTVRGDLKEKNYKTADGTIKNIIHGSDSPENAAYEIELFFE